MIIALLLTGCALAYAGLGQRTRTVPSWPMPAGLALLAVGTWLAAGRHGIGPGLAGCLVMVMATLSLVALAVPLSPRVAWPVIRAVVAGTWIHAIGSL